MTFYQVSFYKHLLSSDGNPFRCLQQSVKIGRARSIERAVLAAQHRFERRWGLHAWDLHADDIDVEIGENGVDYMPSHSASPLSLKSVLRGNPKANPGTRALLSIWRAPNDSPTRVAPARLHWTDQCCR